MTPKGLFQSRKEAAIHYKIDPSYFNKWIKSKPSEFYYIKK
jgi:hypothetical protein